MSSGGTKKPSKRTTRRLLANPSFLSGESSNQAVYSYDLFHVSKDPVAARRLIPPVINYDSTSDLPKMVRLQQKLSATETSYDKSFSFIPENISLHSLAIVPAAKTVHVQKSHRNHAAPDEVVTLDTSRSIISQEDIAESLVLPAIGMSQNRLRVSNKRSGRSPSPSKASQAPKARNTTNMRSSTANSSFSDSMCLNLPSSQRCTSQNNVFISDSPHNASPGSVSLLYAATTDNTQDYGRICHDGGYHSVEGTQASPVTSPHTTTRTPTATTTVSHGIDDTTTSTSTSAHTHTPASTFAPAPAPTLSADNLLCDPEVQALLRISARFEQAYERNSISRYGSRTQSGRATATTDGRQSTRATVATERRASGHGTAAMAMRSSAYPTVPPDEGRSGHTPVVVDEVGVRSGHIYTPANDNGRLLSTQVNGYARTSAYDHNGMPPASAASTRDYASARAGAYPSARGRAQHDSVVDGYDNTRTADSTTNTFMRPSAPPSRGLPVLMDPPALGFPEPQFTLTSSLEQATRAMRAEEAASPRRHARDRSRAQDGEITRTDTRTGPRTTGTRASTRGDTRTGVPSRMSTDALDRDAMGNGYGYGYATNTSCGVYDATPTHSRTTRVSASISTTSTNTYSQARATVSPRMGRGRTARATAYPVAVSRDAVETAPSVDAFATTATSDNTGNPADTGAGMDVGMGIGVGTLGLALVRSPYNLGATVAFAKRPKHNCEAERLSRVDRERRGDEYWVQRSDEGRDMVRSVHGADRHVRGFSCKGYGKGQRGFLRKGEGERVKSGGGEGVGSGRGVGRGTRAGDRSGRVEKHENDATSTDAIAIATAGVDASDATVHVGEDAAKDTEDWADEEEEVNEDGDAEGAEEQEEGVDGASAGTSTSDPASKSIFSSKTSTSGLRKLVQELLEQLQGLKEEEDAERRAVAEEERRWEERVREEEREKREKRRVLDVTSAARVAATLERQRQEREEREKEYEEHRTMALTRAREAVEKKSKDMRALTNNVDAVVARGEEILTARVERLREAIIAADEKQRVREEKSGRERRKKAEVEEERYVLVCEIRRLRVEMEQRMKVLRETRGEKERLRRLVESPRKEEREKERKREREERMKREKERERREKEREKKKREENDMMRTNEMAATSDTCGDAYDVPGEDGHDSVYAKDPYDNNNDSNKNNHDDKDMYASDHGHGGGGAGASTGAGISAPTTTTTATATATAISGADGHADGHAGGGADTGDRDDGYDGGYGDDYATEHDYDNDSGNGDHRGTSTGSSDANASVGGVGVGMEIPASISTTNNEYGVGEAATSTPYSDEKADHVTNAGDVYGTDQHATDRAGDAHSDSGHGFSVSGNAVSDQADGVAGEDDTVSNAYADDDYEDSFEPSRITAPTATATPPTAAVATETAPALAALAAAPVPAPTETSAPAVDVDVSYGDAEFEASVHMRASVGDGDGIGDVNVYAVPLRDNGTNGSDNIRNNDYNDDDGYRDDTQMRTGTGARDDVDNNTDNTTDGNDYNDYGYNQDFSLPEDDHTSFPDVRLPVDAPGSMQGLQGRVSLTRNTHNMNLNFTREPEAESVDDYVANDGIGGRAGASDGADGIGLGKGLGLPEDDEYALDGYADEFED